MKTLANGIGNYKRKRPLQCAAPISEESRARMDAAHRICQERASAAQSPAQMKTAAGIYAQSGLPAKKLGLAVEVQA